MRRALLIGALLAAALPRAATAKPPVGCKPVSIPAALQTTGAPVCIDGVLVTQTTNTTEQNHTDFTVSDHGGHSLDATVTNWWPQGPPQAGMVLTLWGHVVGGRLVVDRWIDLTHGGGPAPDGPYPRARLLDIASGRVPSNRTVWVAATTFLLDPQDGGDGDIHVQTFSPCPAAGLTTEATPPLRGYVDHPAIPGLSSSTDTADEPHAHLADAPPVGVPVMMLGQIRVDYGFGWYELHPIRAWRPLTAAELAEQAAECAADPAPHLDSGPSYAGHALPVPFGVPPCTDGSEFGTPPGFAICSAPHCYVAHTEIGRPETLAGPCDGIEPLVTTSQWKLHRRLPGHGRHAVRASVLARARDEHATERERVAIADPEAGLLRAYGPACAAEGVTAGAPAQTCARALAHLASGEPIPPAAACRAEISAADRAACARAGARTLRRLSALRR